MNGQAFAHAWSTFLVRSCIAVLVRRCLCLVRCLVSLVSFVRLTGLDYVIYAFTAPRLKSTQDAESATCVTPLTFICTSKCKLDCPTDCDDCYLNSLMSTDCKAQFDSPSLGTSISSLSVLFGRSAVKSVHSLNLGSILIALASTIAIRKSL